MDRTSSKLRNQLHDTEDRGSPIRRRTVLGAIGLGSVAVAVESVRSAAEASGGLPLPIYTLSANIETLFPRQLPRDERIKRVAAQGLKAFSFWSVSEQEEEAMLVAQQDTGLACGSIAGSGRIGWTTGFTRTGFEQAYLDLFTQNCEVAKKFSAPNLVIFVGELQKDVPWERQYQQIISGLRETGDIAQTYGVYACLEPLNPIYSPQMSVLSAKEGFKIVAEVDHSHVKLDFDIYHLQLGEGNLINNLRLGLEKNWIQFVEIGDVPGRKQPGTGEVNFTNIFRTLREERYSGYVGMEHGTTSTPEHAVEVVKKMAGAG